MKWKRKVDILTQQDGLVICLGEKRSIVSKEDQYLVEAIKNGICEDEHLKNLIMEHDNSNEIVSGLTLAKFILEYQNYIEKDNGYYEITM